MTETTRTAQGKGGTELKEAAGKPTARERLLLAGFDLFRRKGYCGTSVDDLCAAAGVTKGAFFHHFDSKEALGAATAAYWGEMTGGLFAGAAYHDPKDPLDRVLAYLDFRAALVAGPPEAFTCVAGTLVQEMHLQSPAIRQACAETIFDHAETLEADIAEMLARYGVNPSISAQSLAQHTQTVLQGGFILAKALGDGEPVIEAIAHLKRYICLLCGQTEGQ